MARRPKNGTHEQAAEADDDRKAIELSATENADLCEGCVRCCSYITIEVDNPRQAWEYDQWIWTIDHHGIEMYLEKPECWNVHVATRCDHLKDDGRCRIYESRPILCREYDPRSCERRYPLSDVVAWFHNGAELTAWIKEHRPVHYKRLLAYRGGTAPGWPGDKRHKLHAASLKQSRTEGLGGPALIPISALGLAFANGPDGAKPSNGQPARRKRSGASSGKSKPKRATKGRRSSASSTRR